ncbi:MAG: RusA family crossover junction endodeoxyribonuclease, partial [Nitrospiraceae bacterium]
SVARASSTSLTLLLPVPPSINHQYATVGHRRLLSSVGRKYKTQVAQYVLVALAQLPKRDTLLRTLRENQLVLSIRFHFSAPLRRDVDGGLKITQDALCEALGINDNRVQEIHLYKAWADAPPHIQVSLSPSKIRQGGHTRRMPIKSTLRPSSSD